MFSDIFDMMFVVLSTLLVQLKGPYQTKTVGRVGGGRGEGVRISIRIIFKGQWVAIAKTVGCVGVRG